MPQGATLEIGTIKGIPLYDGDVEAAHGLPATVSRLKEQIVAADGLLLVTPEYNNSLPGVFKNAIDWLSRPSADIPRVFGGRRVAVMGASPGGFGTLLVADGVAAGARDARYATVVRRAAAGFPRARRVRQGRQDRRRASAGAIARVSSRIRRFHRKQVAALDDRRAVSRLVCGARRGRTRRRRLLRAFKRVPRERYVGPGPWEVFAGDRYVETPTADPAFVYQNNLIALRSEDGINNGEPSWHAMWLAALASQPNKTVVRMGAGTGYCTAVLRELVGERGAVIAYESDAELAARAARNLEHLPNVAVHATSAVGGALPECDAIYVNAAVTDLPGQWLDALRSGGRLLAPLTPRTRSVGCCWSPASPATGSPRNSSPGPCSFRAAGPRCRVFGATREGVRATYPPPRTLAAPRRADRIRRAGMEAPDVAVDRCGRG